MQALEPIDLTGWSALLLGLFGLFAALGALRQPNHWLTLVGEVEGSPALQMLCGGLELVTGTLVYLANPWVPGDVLSCLMKGLGGLMMVEALVVLGFSDLYFHFWLKNLAFQQRAWALFSVVFGLGMVVAGAMRFH